MNNRRDFLARTGMTSIAALMSNGVAHGASAATDPDFGSRERAFAAEYDVDSTVVNFDAGYYGAMPRVVQKAYFERIAWGNRMNSTFLRDAVAGRESDAEFDKSRAAVARLLGATQDEIALSGGATDALYSLIVNYRLVKPGDAVIYCDADYDEMQFAMQYLEKSRGASIVRFALPEPYTRANVLAAYEKVLRETPRARLLLLTHVSNRNGLIPPVKEIVALAKARGVDVILDSAHAVGHVPFKVADTGADFIGFSLHKWIAAPLGTGGIYIRKERLADIEPWLGNGVYDPDDIRARISSGTVDFAARMTIPTAIAFHDKIGAQAKFAHLRALRDHWVDQARDIPGVEIVLPAQSDDYGAISSFRMPGMKSGEQSRAVQKLFVAKHGLLVVAKSGLASGPLLRVTPSLFNSRAQLDRLIAAIRAERRMFV